MARKKNILFIVTDDQRFDTIHALGNPLISTPNLDALVRRGTAFTRAHIPSGICGAVCMPSRAMIHTGRQTFHLYGQGEDLPPEQITLGETLQKAGYETIGLGKWHNGCPGYARSFTQGAKIFFGGMWDHWNVPTCRYDPSGAYDNVVNFVVDFFHNNQPMKQHCDEFNPGKHSSEMLTDAAIEMLRKNAGGDKPFFEYVAYLAPHDPRTMPEEFRPGDFPGGVVFEDGFCRLLCIPGNAAFPSIELNSEENIYKSSISVSLCFDKIAFACRVRGRLPGDVIRFGGMTRRVKTLFSDRKLPAGIRASLPLIEDGEGLLWIPGFPPRDGVLWKGDGRRLTFICQFTGAHPELFPETRPDDCAAST